MRAPGASWKRSSARIERAYHDIRFVRIRSAASTLHRATSLITLGVAAVPDDNGAQ
jgi:hypothetical protein